jgi:protein arginine kinase activator
MLCCICKAKEATVHLTQAWVGVDKVQKVDLCEECAEKKGVNDPTGFSLADLMQAAQFSTQISHQTPEI